MTKGKEKPGNVCEERDVLPSGTDAVFEFQIKRGIVNEDQILEDEDVELLELIRDLRRLCAEGRRMEAINLLRSKLVFEFDPSLISAKEGENVFEERPIVVQCTSDNCRVQLSTGKAITITISIEFSAVLKKEITTVNLIEFLEENYVAAACFASPGWTYGASDGDNIRLIGTRYDL